MEDLSQQSTRASGGLILPALPAYLTFSYYYHYYSYHQRYLCLGPPSQGTVPPPPLLRLHCSYFYCYYLLLLPGRSQRPESVAQQKAGMRTSE